VICFLSPLQPRPGGVFLWGRLSTPLPWRSAGTTAALFPLAIQRRAFLRALASLSGRRDVEARAAGWGAAPQGGRNEHRSGGLITGGSTGDRDEAAPKARVSIRRGGIRRPIKITRPRPRAR